MSKRVIHILFAFIIISISALASPTNSQAGSLIAPSQAGSPFELINAVNALRASHGLPQYSISPILMYTAQNQADFMAAIGSVTHSGPGGIGLTDRLLAAGYPLAGDLSLGGFRAENIIGGNESMSTEAAVNNWTGDAPHLNTMLSPDLTEIGAGVSVSNGRVYYVIDAARPTTSGAPQAVTQVSGGGSTIPANETPVPVIVINTPNQSGDVIHEVQAGQTLWQIAISYDVKIDDIKALNNIFDYDIFPGDKLLVKKVTTETLTPLAPLANTATVAPISTAVNTPTMSSQTATPTQAGNPGRSSSNSTVMMVMIGIIALAILGGGLFTRFGIAKSE